MKQRIHPNTTQTNYHYGLAVEEIKLERSINNLITFIDSLDRQDRPQLLLKEVARQERQLSSLRKFKSTAL